MNAKKKLLFSFAGLILSIAIFSTVVFAWFAISNSTGEFIVATGNLETDTKLYHAKYIPETIDGEGNTNAAHYEYTLVDTVADANNLFKDMVPGQVLTFQLEVGNSSQSTIKADYDINLGDIFYGIINNDGTTTWANNNNAISLESQIPLDDQNQNLLYAIHIVCEKISTSVESDFENPEDVEASLIQNVKIYESDFSSLADTLVNKLNNKTISKAKTGDDLTLEVGETDVYIIKFYFNPMYGKYKLPDGTIQQPNSNNFRLKTFKIGNITVNYTQKQEITE